MASNDPTSTIILIEIIVVQTLIILGIGIFLFLQKKKKAKLIGASILAFKENSAERNKLLTANFSSINNDEISANIQNIVEKEIELHHYISNSFYKNDLTKFILLDQEIFGMVSPYAELISSISSAAMATNSEPDQKSVTSDVDNAIEELLLDDDKDDNDPALDLSDDTNKPSIAEIPNELLDSNTETAESSKKSNKPE